MFLIILLYAISASTTLIGKILLNYTTPIFLTGLRTFIAGAIFLAFASYNKKIIGIKRDLIYFFAIALSSFYLSNSLKFWALRYITNNTASLLSITEPIFAGILAYLLFAHKLTFKTIALLFVTTLGALLSQINLSSIELSLTLPIAIFIFSIALSSYGALLMRYLIKDKGYCPTIVNGLTMLFAGVLSLSTSFGLEATILKPINSEFLYLLATMVIISNLIAYQLYGTILKKHSILLISSAGFLRPFFSSIYDWAICAKAITPNMFLGTIIVLIGIILLYMEENKYLIKSNIKA